MLSVGSDDLKVRTLCNESDVNTKVKITYFENSGLLSKRYSHRSTKLDTFYPLRLNNITESKTNHVTQVTKSKRYGDNYN